MECYSIEINKKINTDRKSIIKIKSAVFNTISSPNLKSVPWPNVSAKCVLVSMFITDAC